MGGPREAQVAHRARTHGRRPRVSTRVHVAGSHAWSSMERPISIRGETREALWRVRSSSNHDHHRTVEARDIESDHGAA